MKRWKEFEPGDLVKLSIEIDLITDHGGLEFLKRPELAMVLGEEVINHGHGDERAYLKVMRTSGQVAYVEDRMYAGRGSVRLVERLG